jgi:hypothetical protein
MGIIACMLPNGIILYIHPMGIIACMLPNGIILYIHPMGIVLYIHQMVIVLYIHPMGIMLYIHIGGLSNIYIEGLSNIHLRAIKYLYWECPPIEMLESHRTPLPEGYLISLLDPCIIALGGPSNIPWRAI